MSSSNDMAWDFLTGEPERDRRNLRLLMESVGELYTLVDPQERMRRAVDRAIAVMGAERGVLLLEGHDGVRTHVARDRGGKDLPLDVRYSTSAVRRVTETHRPFRTIDGPDAPGDSLGHSVVDLKLYSIMATPLVFEGESLGVLYVDATYRVKEFTEHEFKVFCVLGGLVSTALANAELEQDRVERDRLERQVENASAVQQSLLPRNVVAPKGLDIAGDARTCYAMSGDYYDVIPRSDGQVAVVVGDVSGHGIAQALYMAATRALLHDLMRLHGLDPAEALVRINARLESDMKAEDFMTMFVGLVDPASQTLHYASAGHNPPFLWRQGDGITELPKTGMPLGMFDGARYRLADPVSLRPGDVLVLYTDGIYEARSASGEMYGEERLSASLARHAGDGADARGVLTGLLADLDAFRGEAPLEDDITCLVIRA